VVHEGVVVVEPFQHHGSWWVVMTQPGYVMPLRIVLAERVLRGTLATHGPAEHSHSEATTGK
jgi:hypothetical protein